MSHSVAETSLQAAYPRHQVCAGILAGGQGSRMGGVDKGLVPLAGRPMIAHVIAALREQVVGIVISANRSLDQYRQFDYPVVPDDEPGFAGPLAGLAALLAAADTNWLLLAPCDSPAVAHDLGMRLWQAASQHRADIAVAQLQGRLQPVFALVQCTLAARLRADLAAGWRKTGDWFHTQNMVAVDFSDRPEMFVNVNTRQERDRWACRVVQAGTPAQP